MKKTPIISLLFCLLLTSCSKPTDIFSSYEEAQSALISLNTALSAQPNSQVTQLSNEQLPFTDAYLERRHAIYQQLMQMQLSAEQTNQVNYLVIAERFPERYFAWPAHTDVLSNMLSIVKNDAQYKSIDYWLIFVQTQLKAAEQSNLKLNKINPDKCFFAAASNSEGFGKFKAKTLLNHSTGGGLSEEGRLSVNKIKIDNFKLEKKICGIKIDTEGNEFEVLEGAQNYINKDKPDILFEINENCFDKCLELLKFNGYDFYFVDEIDAKITKIVKFNNNLKRQEGSNCYATFNNTQ